jgi:YD repeat-containing protein
LNAAGKAESDALSEKFGLPFGIAIALGIVGLFFKWWIGLILFLVSYAIGATVIMEKNKPKFDELSAIVKEKKATLEYANATLSSLSNKEKERVNSMEVDLLVKYRETQKIRREIEQIKAQIDALSRPSYSSSTTRTTSSGSSTKSSAGGRAEIVDDAGRRQGYVEDGRIYNDKSDVVGYVDSDRRVYDADHRRVGEVRSDGKIEKYR